MTPHSGSSDVSADLSATSGGRADARYGVPTRLSRRRLWLLLATAAVLAFELCMLWLARTPQVDDHYRRYFIEHATTCYRPMGEVPVLALGERYPVRKGEPLGNCGVLWEGFYSPKEDRPVSARQAQVGLRLKVTPGLRQPVVVALALSRYPDDAELRPVEVWGEGELLARWPVGGRQASHEVEVPEQLIQPDGSLHLTLKGPPPIAPRDVGIDGNKFPVGLRLDSVMLRSTLGLTPPDSAP
ncbi:hypothetical protein OW493_02295 [Cobetia sp. 14N.309.X.WAT.E.A4]|uniref:hypothetical protein n=1 Tax=Cobetia sp. 14N.309.X.WAT.E.A4 TaxID=2998323 RepID=UPI0025B092BF|nr:hypothetical protein [Cobetia sp. 14N.309.X.WAT.E.A4]MDN2655277.1 hypothetical protein [Cobetia sp. 14N.309.X.WAT.E.A4]